MKKEKGKVNQRIENPKKALDSCFLVVCLPEGLRFVTDELEELVACLGLVEGASEVAGGGDGTLLLDTAHLHAHVLGLDYDHHSQGLKGFLYGFAYLQRHAFLHLQAMAVAVDHAGYLGEACDVAVGDVSHMGFAVEGYHVVLAEGVEVDVLDDDHLAVVFLELGLIEYLDGVFVVASCEVGHSFCHTDGCLLQSFALRVFTDEGEQLTHPLLNIRQLLVVHRHRH